VSDTVPVQFYQTVLLKSGIQMMHESRYQYPDPANTADDTTGQLSVSQEILEATTLVEKVMTIIRDRINAMSLMPGARLPSIRRLSETMSVSKSTVVEAYDRLVAEGIIQARKTTSCPSPRILKKSVTATSIPIG
jgi:hypothetical protein